MKLYRGLYNFKTVFLSSYGKKRVLIAVIQTRTGCQVTSLAKKTLKSGSKQMFSGAKARKLIELVNEPVVLC